MSPFGTAERLYLCHSGKRGKTRLRRRTQAFILNRLFDCSQAGGRAAKHIRLYRVVRLAARKLDPVCAAASGEGGDLVAARRLSAVALGDKRRRALIATARQVHDPGDDDLSFLLDERESVAGAAAIVAYLSARFRFVPLANPFDHQQ